MPLVLKDMRSAPAKAENAGAPMPSLNVVRDRLNTGIARGYGVLDWTAPGLTAAERRDSTSPSTRLQLKIGSQGANMKNLFAVVFTVACATLSASASAQVLPQVPDLQTRIPAPLPPPPAPPTINGPMIQGAAPEVIAPRLSQHSAIARDSACRKAAAPA